jgi:SET domain-containing protein
MKLHSYLSPKCFVKQSPVQGFGIFAKKDIKKNEVVSLWGGIIYSAKEVDSLSRKHPHFSTHTVSVYDGFYLGPVNPNGLDDSEFFNHSCEPNVGVKGQIAIVSRRNIKKGEELYFDYDTTETTSEGWFYCKCGSKNCRKKIDGTAWKNRNFLKKNKDFLSWYIKEKVNRKY